MPKNEVVFIGKGNVAKALARDLERAGHEVRLVGKDAAAINDAARWSELVFMAVPFTAVDDIVKTAGAAFDADRGQAVKAARSA